MKKWTFPGLLLFAFVLGCVTATKSQPKEDECQRLESISFSVRVGMPKQAIFDLLGTPQARQTVPNSKGRGEIWTYTGKRREIGEGGCYFMVTFLDGEVLEFVMQD